MTARLQVAGDHIAVWFGDELFAAYKFPPDQHLPYWFPVNAAGGIGVTQEFPTLYPHHRSLWLGHGNVNGADFWLGRPDSGRIRHLGLLWQRTVDEGVEFAVQAAWQLPNGQTLLRDERVWRCWQSGTLRLVDATITLHALLPEIVLGKTNHALFCVRVRPELAVVNGGQLCNSEGGINESGTMGQRARWCAAFGTVNDTTVGIALFDHPNNPWHPSQWFTRDYGFLSPSPFNWDAWRLTPEQPLHLRYRVAVFVGEPDLDALMPR
ncbi:hypothetical protein HRbin17_02031 [bacterium HR17]|jgi:hypothetical protein|uniref:Uncharacterized protein n=1 Tax=Candidatus Fervidibacter japonicus TaxID=2035412 RepID=A0A2H5XE99_9BACT|nr:hypothetical protein HRbin17_02031 [bacterium HR17]